MLPMAVARSRSGGVVSDVLCTSGFMDDVISAHKPRLLEVAAQPSYRRSSHAALGSAVNSAWELSVTGNGLCAGQGPGRLIVSAVTVSAPDPSPRLKVTGNGRATELYA